MKELFASIFNAVKMVLGKFGITAETDNEFAWVNYVFEILFS